MQQPNSCSSHGPSLQCLQTKVFCVQSKQDVSRWALALGILISQVYKDGTIKSKSLLTHWRRELFSESRLQEFQPRLASLATCKTAHSRSVALHALHALLYTVKRLIVRWHAALFMLQHSCGQGSRRGHCEAGDFHANLAFSFLDNTQRSITIYTRARVSFLSPCSLEHWPSIIAEKPAVETKFLPRL